jgi:hypothetical protein
VHTTHLNWATASSFSIVPNISLSFLIWCNIYIYRLYVQLINTRLINQERNRIKCGSFILDLSTYILTIRASILQQVARNAANVQGKGRVDSGYDERE